MTFWEFLNRWWNLPCLVMLGVVGVFFALQAVGMFAHATGADHDADHDVDTGADHDVDADHDLDHGHGLASFFGVGRVPFMVVWLTLFIFTGFSGIFLNRLLQVRTGEYQPWFFPVSLLLSLASGSPR